MKRLYEEECNRAELFGSPKPSWNEFLTFNEQQPSISTEKNCGKSDEKNFENEVIFKEDLNKIGGGLDELNSTLVSTQKKINRLKTIFGGCGNILKICLNDENHDLKDVNNTNTLSENNTVTNQIIEDGPTFSSHVQNSDGHLSKLDNLINKAERAELSLSGQNKQMKKFLK